MAAFLRPGFCTTSKHARTSLMIGFVCAICIADTTARGHSGAKAASQLRPLAIEVSGCRLTVKQSRFRCRAIGRRSSHPARLPSSINSQVATEFRHSQRCSRPDGNLYRIGVQSPFGVSPVFSTSQWRSLPPRGVQRCLLGLKSVQKIIPGM